MKNILLVFLVLASHFIGFSQKFDAWVFVTFEDTIWQIKALRAQFGSQSIDDIGGFGLMGRDSTSQPTRCCGNLVNDVNGKIAVIDRGTCEFGKKVLNAQNEGALAAIICKGVTNDYIISMGPGSFGSQVTIPAFMIEQELCQKLNSMSEDSSVLITIKDHCENIADFPPNIIWGNIQGQGDFYHGLNGWTIENPLGDSIGWGFKRNGKIPLLHQENFKVSPWSSCDGAMTFVGSQLQNFLGIDTNKCESLCGSLLSPVIDISERSPIEGLAIHFYQSAVGIKSSYKLHISFDGGITWPHIYNLNESLLDSGCLFMALTKIHIAEYSGQKTVRFKFEHETIAGNWGIDDVFLTNERVSSTKDIEPLKMVHIWPNPVSGRLNISLHEPIQKLDLIGSDGRLLSTLGYVSIANNDASIDVSYLPNGIYFAKVLTHSGTFVEQFVVVK